MTGGRSVVLRFTAIVIAGLGIFPLAVLIRYSPVVAWLPAAATEWAITTPFTIAACIALAALAPGRTDRLIARGRSVLLAGEDREFRAWIALLVLCLSMLAAWWCFRLEPAGGDEMAQRFQAQLLRHGRLSAVAEEAYAFVSGIQTASIDGRWFSQFPIGGPALLALGGLFRLEWLVNPVLAAWTAVNLHRFASVSTTAATARGVTVLFALSPFVLLMSGSQMNHVGALAFTMLAVAACAAWADESSTTQLNRHALTIGFGVGMTATIRPYEAAFIALLLGAFQLRRVGSDAGRRRSLAWQVAGGALPVAILLWANWRTTGAPLLFAYDALNGASHRPGFHVDPAGVQFGPMEGLHHASSYLLLLNSSLLGGPIPALLLAVVAMATMRREQSADRLMSGLLLAIVFAYGIYWAESFFVGPRFLYLAVPAVLWFIAHWPSALADRFTSPVVVRAIHLLVPASIAVAWLQPVGLFHWQGVLTAAAEVRAGGAGRPVEIARDVARSGLEHALVFVHESWHGRLAARLRSVGTPALTAESFVREFDACALHLALDEEESLPAPTTGTRMNRIARRALMAGPARLVQGPGGVKPIAIASQRSWPAKCFAELDADRAGSTALDPFLGHATFDDDGRLGGRVVFVRDFGPRNSALLARFGDRTWYRYRPRDGAADQAPVFVPYIGR